MPTIPHCNTSLIDWETAEPSHFPRFWQLFCWRWERQRGDSHDLDILLRVAMHWVEENSGYFLLSFSFWRIGHGDRLRSLQQISSSLCCCLRFLSTCGMIRGLKPVFKTGYLSKAYGKVITRKMICWNSRHTYSVWLSLAFSLNTPCFGLRA